MLDSTNMLLTYQTIGNFQKQDSAFYAQGVSLYTWNDGVFTTLNSASPIYTGGTSTPMRTSSGKDYFDPSTFSLL